MLINVYIKNKESDKIYAGAMSATDEYFKLNDILWNRVIVTFDSSRLDEVKSGDELVLEAKATNVMLDALMITRRDNEAQEIFVSNAESDSKNLGTKEQPFTSLKRVSAFEMKPGDKVWLKRGDVFHEKLYLSGKGTESH